VEAEVAEAEVEVVVAAAGCSSRTCRLLAAPIPRRP
jgi:hypothetical protein